MPKKPIIDPTAIKGYLIDALQNDPLYRDLFSPHAAGMVGIAYDSAVTKHIKDLIDAADPRPHWRCENCGEEGGNLSKPVTMSMEFCTLCAGGVTQGKREYGSHDAHPRG